MPDHAKVVSVCPTFLAIGLSLAPGGASQAVPRTSVRLLLPGDVQTRSRPELGDDPWFGLYHTSQGGYELRRTIVSIEDTRRGCGDQGRRITTESDSSPLFLIAGGRDLREGRIDSVFTGMRFVYPAEMVRLKLGDVGWYMLTAFGTARPATAEIAVTDYELVLERVRRRQVLASFPRIDGDGPPQLIWAGDIDRDERLDLLLDLRRSYVGHRYVLFLSSLAGGDELVAPAGEFGTAGC